MLFLATVLFLTNFIYTFKIALELNLGFSVIINAVELFHILVVEVALVALYYSMYQKSSFPLDLMDRESFTDMSLIYNLDQYCIIALNSSLIFYPFRFFAFISRYNFSTSIRGILNTVVRISPGLFTYFTIVVIIAFSISASLMGLVGPFIPEMSNVQGAVVMSLSTNLLDLPQIREDMATGINVWQPIIIFFYQKLMVFSLVICIALAVYLFVNAIQYEETIAV